MSKYGDVRKEMREYLGIEPGANGRLIFESPIKNGIRYKFAKCHLEPDALADLQARVNRVVADGYSAEVYNYDWVNPYGGWAFGTRRTPNMSYTCVCVRIRKI